VSEDRDLFGTLLSGGGILFLGIVLQLGINFGAKLAIARLLGKVDYGAVSLGATLMSSVVVLVLVGTDTGVGRFLPRQDDPSYRRGVLASAFAVVMPLAVVVGVGLALFSEPMAAVVFGDPEIAPVLQVFALAVPLMTFLRLTVGSIRGMQEAFPRVALQNIALPMTRFGLIAVALLAGFRARGVAWAYAGAYAIVAVGALYYLSRRTPLFGGESPEWMPRELFAFSAPLMVVASMNMVLANVDTFLLGALATTADIGVYNVAYPLASLLTVVLSSFGFLFMPIISELHADGDYASLRRTYQIVSKWIFVASLPLFLFVASFPGFVIRNSFGAEYTAGALALSILAVGFFTHAVAGPSGNTLTAAGHTRLIMYDNTLVAAVNVLLNLVLIPRYSLLGAAVATTVGYVLMNVLYVVQLDRRLGVHPFRSAMIVPGVGAVTLWAALYWLVGATVGDTFAGVLGTLAVFAVCYVGLLLRFGVEREELGLLTRIGERIGVDLDPVRSVAERFVD
jgi:O-antigen/teichoic acid export membrane protein